MGHASTFGFTIGLGDNSRAAFRHSRDVARQSISGKVQWVVRGRRSDAPAVVRSRNRASRFVAHTAYLAFVGVLMAGPFGYTYGHSLGVILLSLAVLGPPFRNLKALEAAL